MQVLNLLSAVEALWRSTNLCKFCFQNIEIALEEFIHFLKMCNTQLNSFVNKSVSFDRVFLCGKRAVHNEQLVS